MSSSRKLEDGDLSVETTWDGNVTRCAWTGQSTSRRPAETLQPYFDEVIAGTSAGGALEMSFLDLTYFNSSTVAVIIHTIKVARESGVKLELLYDPSAPNHEKNFNSLRIFERNDGLLELKPVRRG